ncbi:MAG TPA: hypothetical protein VFA05_08530 [Gaiellaceae bacterium]|nr:hypothetical protein [Gaiellaceae bacterium]
MAQPPGGAAHQVLLCAANSLSLFAWRVCFGVYCAGFLSMFFFEFLSFDAMITSYR